MADLDRLAEGALAVLAQQAAAGNAQAACRLLDAVEDARDRKEAQDRRAALLGDDPIAIAREAGLSGLSTRDVDALLGRAMTKAEAATYAKHRIVFLSTERKRR